MLMSYSICMYKIDNFISGKEICDTINICKGIMCLELMYEGWLISNAHSEISRKRDHVFKQTKVGSKVQYFSYKLTYLFFNIAALSFSTFFPT